MFKSERGRRPREETRASMGTPLIQTVQHTSLGSNRFKMPDPLIGNMETIPSRLASVGNPMTRTAVKDNGSHHASAELLEAQQFDPVPVSGYEPGKLYTTEQVAAVTGLDKKTFEAWRLKGVGGPAYIKLGRAVRYQGKDLMAWIAANRRTSTSEG